MTLPVTRTALGSPRWPLPAWALGLLLGGVLATVLWVGPAHREAAGPAVAPAATAQLDCRFDDADDGAVLVRDAASGALLARVAPGEQGFLRGTLRALVRERRQQGLGAEQPFRLLRLADGRLALRDPATGRQLDLSAFGPTNAALFARLLPAAPAR